MDTRITEETNPQLHAKLVKIWKGDKMKRANVIGPGGVNYKVYTPDDNTIIFAPQTGLDGTYATRSTEGLAGS